MSDVYQLIQNPVMFHALLKILATYCIFMAVVSALPTPKENSTMFYIFVFRFFHALSMNFNRAAVALKVPGAEAETKQP